MRRLRHRLAVLARISTLHNSDVQGSYTGRPKYGEQPVQDADDL